MPGRPRATPLCGYYLNLDWQRIAYEIPMRMNMRGHYLNLDYGQLHYRSNDARAATPLLLLHQSPSDSRMYETLAAELGDNYWIIAPDNPGFGASDSLPGGFNLEACATVLRDLLRHLAIDRCLVFGHHTGASIAVQFASDFPASVQRLALSGPTLLTPELKAALPGLGSAIPGRADGSHLPAMWQRLRAKEADTPRAILQRELSNAFAAGDNYPQAYAAVATQDFEGRLRSLAIPVLVFAGTLDLLYPQLQASYDCLQQGKMATVEAAGSYICERQAAEVAGLLRDFFDND